MTFNAHFDGKVIVPDESALAWIAANAVDSDGLPTDLADEHDHYLYGGPKKNTNTEWPPTSLINSSGSGTDAVTATES